MTRHRREDDDLEIDPTRRDWLLRLGEVTVLAGVAGVVPEVATALTGAERQAAGTLPPGLYEPSTAHLGHAIAVQGSVVAPPGTETGYVLPRRGPYQPQFFSESEFATIAALVGVVLGNVEASSIAGTAEWLDLRVHAAGGARQAARRLDPLHRALAVAYYRSDEPVKTIETTDVQAVAREGVALLDRRARERYSRSFVQATLAERSELIAELGGLPPSSASRRGYDLLRREIIRGYYTSQAGLQELGYKGNAFYAQCPGCELKT